MFIYIQSASVPQSVIQKRLWLSDAALRTVPTTDRQASEAFVPTAACLAAYLFPGHEYEVRFVQSLLVSQWESVYRGGKKELTARMKETRS